jgi:hypothetical protein
MPPMQCATLLLLSTSTSSPGANRLINVMPFGILFGPRTESA